MEAVTVGVVSSILYGSLGGGSSLWDVPDAYVSICECAWVYVLISGMCIGVFRRWGFVWSIFGGLSNGWNSNNCMGMRRRLVGRTKIKVGRSEGGVLG